MSKGMQFEVTTEAERVKAQERSSDWFGMVLGVAIFLSGIVLLFVTFYMAAQMFATPAPLAVGIGNNPDITQIGISFFDVMLKVGLLVVMSIVGSLISGKGVRMYLAARMRETT